MLALPTLVVMNAVSTPCRRALSGEQVAEDTGRVYRTDFQIPDPVVSCGSWIVDCPESAAPAPQLGFTTNPYIIFFRLCHMRESINDGIALTFKSERVHATYSWSCTLILFSSPVLV